MSTRRTASAEEFGAAIKETRRKQGLTQRQLAFSVGAGERFIVDLEKGKETIRLGKAIEVAAALGLKLTMSDES